MDDANQVSTVITDRVAEMSCGHCKALVDVSEAVPFTPFDCPGCGHHQVVPARLGQFLLVRLIGMGGMGGVYHAKDESLGRFVAIKVMLQSLGSDPQFVASFKREAQAVAKLNHPNIAQVYSFGQEKGQPYIVMELVAGKSFDKIIEEQQPLDQALVMRIALQVAEGLRAADEAGLLHGDIKPENILLDEKHNVKIIDFGLATVVNQRQSQGIWGTPYYIAPEKVLRLRLDARADIYSLGASLYHALTGQPPFEGNTPLDVVKARIDREPESILTRRPDLSPEIAAIVHRMLLPDPATRYPTYASLVSDIRRVLDTLTPAREGSKKILIKKRGAKSATADTAAAAEGPPPADGEPPKSGKIVVRRPSRVTVPSLTDAGAEAAAPAPETPAEGTAETPRPQRRLLPWFLAGAAVLVLAGLAVATIVLVRRHKDKVRLETAARLEKYELGKARLEGEKLLAELQPVVNGVTNMAAGADAFMAQATNAVFLALDEVFEIPQPPPPPAPPPPAAEPQAGSTNLPAATDATNAPPASTNGTESATNAVPVASDATAAGASNAVAAPPPDPPPAPPAAVEEPPPDEPEVKRLARKVIAACWKMKESAQQAVAMAAQAAQAGADLAQAPDSSLARTNVATIAEGLAAARALEPVVKSSLDEARSGLRTMEGIVARTRQERESRRRAEEATAKLRAEDEARKREEEKRKALTEAELGQMETERNNVLPLIKKNKFEEALDQLKARLPGYETAEGKAALKVLIDRATRLNDFKASVVERLTRNPLKWGWVQGRSPEDILGATAQAIQLRGREVPWEEVTPKQFVYLLKYYSSSSDLTPREQADVYLAAAIYCFEHAGVDAAKPYAEKAASGDSTGRFEEEVKRLIPGL